MVRPTINSEKHISQRSVTNVAFGAIANFVIAEAKKEPLLATDVRIGATIKAVFIEMWTNGTDAQQTSTTQVFEKLQGTQPFMSAPDIANLHDYANKKNCFNVSQGLIGDSNSNPMALMRQWYKIPKGKQRMGLGDKLVYNISGLTNDVDVCGFFLYKEYF